MKKIMLLILVAIFTASSAMAVDYDNYGSGTAIDAARVVCGATDTLEIGLSPKIAALYRTNAATNPQWYLVATVHIGGTEAYATAQNVTKTYKKTYSAGTAITDAFSGLGTAPASEDDFGTGWAY